MPTTREALATELLRGCPAESRADHERIADALQRGDAPATILAMPEMERWPETYRWISIELRDDT
jgi:hypothetical protein